MRKGGSSNIIRVDTNTSIHKELVNNRQFQEKIEKILNLTKKPTSSRHGIKHRTTFDIWNSANKL